MDFLKRFGTFATIGALLIPSLTRAQIVIPPDLKSAAIFSALGSGNLTISGQALVGGAVGTTPTKSVVVMSPAVQTGALHLGDDAAATAMSDFRKLYQQLQENVNCESILGVNIAPMTFGPGLHCANEFAVHNGVVKLDAHGKSDSIFVFKVKTQLTVRDDASVELLNGALSKNVYWLVGTSAIIGANVRYKRTVMSNSSIEVGSGSVIDGRLLSQNDNISIIGATVRLPSSSDLALTASSLNSSPKTGESFRYTITITNNGPDVATGVKVSAAIPGELMLESATPSVGTYTAPTWNIGELAVGQPATLQLSVKVRDQLEGKVIRFIAEVAGADQGDPNSTPQNLNDAENDWASVVVNIYLPAQTAAPTTDPTATGAYSPGAALAATPSIDVDKNILIAPSGISYCPAGSLIKGSSPSVYFCGKNQKRYVFPNDKVFFSWYQDFSQVILLSDDMLARVPLGGNVTYRPGSFMVKVQSDPRVYVVSRGGLLRHVSSEALATVLYGASWKTKIHDIPDAFFVNYSIGDPVTSQ